MKSILANKGFGMIEIIITLAITALIILSIGQTLALIYRAYNASILKTLAISYTQEPLEIINSIKNEIFACTCSNDTCTIGYQRTCTKNGQICTLFESYNSCWLQYPDGHIGQSRFDLIEDGGNWQLEEIFNPVPLDVNPIFSREIIIENIKRDNDGNINSSGNLVDQNTKKVTVNVYWSDRGHIKSINLSNLFTAWQNLE